MLPTSIDLETFLLHGDLPVGEGIVVDVPAPELDYPAEVIDVALGVYRAWQDGGCDPDDRAFRECLARSTPP